MDESTLISSGRFAKLTDLSSRLLRSERRVTPEASPRCRLFSERVFD